MVDIKELNDGIKSGIFYEELDISHRKIYISEFPWRMIMDNVYNMGMKLNYPFSLSSLINWYNIDLIGKMPGNWEYGKPITDYLKSEYKRYNKICPPVKFDINKDELCNLLITYYRSIGDSDTEAIRSAEWIYKCLTNSGTGPRMPEIIAQCHYYTSCGWKIIADYLLTVKKHNGNKHLLYEEDIDIKDLLKLKSEDKLRLLGIEL